MLSRKSEILSHSIIVSFFGCSFFAVEISLDIFTNLSFISFAALLVKVTAKILVIGICFPRMR